MEKLTLVRQNILDLLEQTEFLHRCVNAPRKSFSACSHSQAGNAASMLSVGEMLLLINSNLINIWVKMSMNALPHLHTNIPLTISIQLVSYLSHGFQRQSKICRNKDVSY